RRCPRLPGPPGLPRACGRGPPRRCPGALQPSPCSWFIRGSLPSVRVPGFLLEALTTYDIIVGHSPIGRLTSILIFLTAARAVPIISTRRFHGWALTALEDKA